MSFLELCGRSSDSFIIYKVITKWNRDLQHLTSRMKVFHYLIQLTKCSRFIIGSSLKSTSWVHQFHVTDCYMSFVYIMHTCTYIKTLIFNFVSKMCQRVWFQCSPVTFQIFIFKLMNTIPQSKATLITISILFQKY